MVVITHRNLGALDAISRNASMPITFCFQKTADNESMSIAKMSHTVRIHRVHYFTGAALGSGLGIDVMDGGTDGSGATVINACTDNLNGKEVKDVSPGYTLAKNRWLKLNFDNYATATFCSVIVEGEILSG